MKKLFENWRSYLLTEATDLLQSANGSVVIFSDWAKGHIEGGHKVPGKGSIFAKFDLSLIGKAVSQINVNENTAVYTISVPGVGYDLVLPMSEAIKLPDAEKVEVEKEERSGPVKVVGIKTSRSLQSFLQDKLSVVVRPTTSLEHVPDDVKEKIAPAIEKGRVYSILSAWPGRGDVPPASQWGGKWAVIIPQMTPAVKQRDVIEDLMNIKDEKELARYIVDNHEEIARYTIEQVLPGGQLTGAFRLLDNEKWRKDTSKVIYGILKREVEVLVEVVKKLLAGDVAGAKALIMKVIVREVGGWLKREWDSAIDSTPEEDAARATKLARQYSRLNENKLIISIKK